MKKKKSTSIKTLIIVPVLILGLVAIISGVMAITNTRNVNSKATTISDKYMVGIEKLATIQRYSQDIHNEALSHIIATDLNTMTNIVTTITKNEEELDKCIEEYSQFVNSNDKNYVALKSDYASMKDSIKVLLAYSANQDNVSAYATANGDVATYANSMESDITAINDSISKDAEAAKQTLSRVYGTSFIINVIVIIISFVSVFSAVFIVLIFVIKPILLAEREITDIINDIDNAQGDLTKRITVKNNDEIGALGNGINTFMEKLQQIFIVITNNSGKMEQVVSEVLGSVHTSNDSASDLSAVTEELAATMQEVSNSANAINANAEEVSTEVNIIAERSSEINNYSKTMKQHADAMEQSARTNMEQTSAKVNEILAVLNQAIEDSKSVDQVNSLTNDILTISSQTNLLALNASIEAARAGEAGKGFSVVAGEISQLADSSRDAANHIQEINGIVTAAVHNLSTHANSLVEYMQDSILPEFEKFVQEGGEYKENATYIESTMNDFNLQTDNLKGVVSDIAASINTISAAISEGVKGVSGAAESTQTLVYDMDNISLRMDENQRIAGDLQKETSIFIKV